MRYDSNAVATSTSTARRYLVPLLLAVVLFLIPLKAFSEIVPGSMDVHWDEGAANCATSTQPPLQVHDYNDRTFILRENLCKTFEAPFMYLLVGSKKALLIDSGDVADPSQVPLAKTVIGVLPENGPDKIPLLVVHTHRHLDHRAGDAQFAHVENVDVVGYDVDSVRKYYGFTNWPNGLAHINLGDRIVDVIPTPGHSETEVSFYDGETGLFFSGDFLAPCRLLIDDTKTDIASAEKAAAFAQDHTITYVLGGHIEKDSAGNLFPWQSQYHPHEHVLQMTKDDLVALPAALRTFNGFSTVSGKFMMMNSIHELILAGTVVVIALLVIIWLLVRYIRRRKRTKLEKLALQNP